MRTLVLLGSTGSVGTQAIEVVKAHPTQFKVVGLAAAGNDVAQLARQAVDLGVEVVGVADSAAATALQQALQALHDSASSSGSTDSERRPPKIVAGPDAATQVAGWPAEMVVNAITGSIGLLPTLAALRAGRTLALANKESLIVGGPLVKAAARPGQIVPVDSEHSALAQCLRGGGAKEVSRLVLTASGGPFRGWTRADMGAVGVEQALAHPTWDMGPVVTVNSATLVNKGLELIEAHLLFDIAYDRIDVVVHPQSVVHSMVEFVDGSTLLQASPPDMRLPIALALGWPDRVPGAVSPCDWTKAEQWDFLPLADPPFAAVSLARMAGMAGGTAPAVYNAANEECVTTFLAGNLPFLSIVDCVASVLHEHLGRRVGAGVEKSDSAVENELTVDDVLSAEQWARQRARQILEGAA